MTPRSANPCDRGTRSEGAVLAALLKLGKRVLVPYVVPVDAVRIGTDARLRVDSPRNGQRKRIIWAEPYRLTTDSFLAA